MGGVGHFPITDLVENVSEISSLHSCLTFSSGFDYIHFKFGSCGDVTLLRVLAVILFLVVPLGTLQLLNYSILAGPHTNKQWFQG